jgi:hypothetical protein
MKNSCGIKVSEYNSPNILQHAWRRKNDRSPGLSITNEMSKGIITFHEDLASTWTIYFGP